MLYTACRIMSAGSEVAIKGAAANFCLKTSCLKDRKHNYIYNVTVLFLYSLSFMVVSQVEMVTKDEKIVPVSLWLRKLETEGRCLAVAEPVERRVAQVYIQ
jgi:hypothetical protein